MSPASPQAPRLAIVLAAGVGSRLRPVTNHVPKCLVRVAGKPMLQYQLEALEAAGVQETLVVSGYRSRDVKVFLDAHRSAMRVRMVDNHDYAITNNMHSVVLALQSVDVDDSGLLLMNGDLVFEADLIKKLVAGPRDAIACFRDMYVQESMKIRLGREGRVSGISKQLTAAESHGISLDVYRISAGSLAGLRRTMEEILAGDRKQWTELALDRTLADGSWPAQPVDMAGLRWMEIDDFSDLQQAEILFNPLVPEIRRKKAFFFDGDGTLFMDDEVLPGAREVIAWLRGNGRSVHFITNNSSRSSAQYAERLAAMGLPFEPRDIVTSTGLLVRHLLSRGITRVFVVGTPALCEELAGHGIVESAEPQAVLVGYDTTLTYEKLGQATRLLARNLPLIATHGDAYCPTPTGPVPDAGAIVALLEATTGQKAEILGKPHPEMITAKLAAEGIDAGDAVHIGDRLHTDVLMGQRAGVRTICVLSGEATREQIELSPVRPDLILEDLRGLLSILTEEGAGQKSDPHE